jgi:hypothetical protein
LLMPPKLAMTRGRPPCCPEIFFMIRDSEDARSVLNVRQERKSTHSHPAAHLAPTAGPACEVWSICGFNPDPNTNSTAFGADPDRDKFSFH